MRSLLAALLSLVLGACAAPTQMPDVAARIDSLLPADVVLVGEQHDAPEHQQIHRELIEALAARGVLAGVALEMAAQGTSTAALPRNAPESDVQAALRWPDEDWPWAPYAPAIMSAVRAGVPVAGANLPRTSMRNAMAETALDTLLPGPALKAQQQAIRQGHCDLLPESQIAPMTRIQIARDRAIAQTIANLRVPGKTVVLLAGANHVDRGVGVPLHLPAGLKVTTLALRAGSADDDARKSGFDSTWVTPPVPPKDYCADVRKGRVEPA
jgi:uncharacterized iron-regulated protein